LPEGKGRGRFSPATMMNGEGHKTADATGIARKGESRYAPKKWNNNR